MHKVSDADSHAFQALASQLREVEIAKADQEAAKKEEKKAAKEKTRIELAKSTPMDIDSADTMAAMGFAGFGTSKK